MKYQHTINEEVHRIKKLMNLNEASASSNSLFGGTSFSWGGGPGEHGSRALGNWQSDNAWDIMAKEGTPVYALDGGTVTKAHFAPYRRVIYGWQITVSGKENDIFYTHLSEKGPKINVGSKIEKGDLIGIIGKPTQSWPTHVHIGIGPSNKKDNISKYISNSGNLKNFIGSSQSILQNKDFNFDNFDLQSMLEKILSFIFKLKL